jgi:hypothetical protein
VQKDDDKYDTMQTTEVSFLPSLVLYELTITPSGRNDIGADGTNELCAASWSHKFNFGRSLIGGMIIPVFCEGATTQKFHINNISQDKVQSSLRSGVKRNVVMLIRRNTDYNTSFQQLTKND